jgi:hypothetical protein
MDGRFFAAITAKVAPAIGGRGKHFFGRRLPVTDP